jgi:type IV secretory pathway TraG/TraD family ATPase VirD4
LNLCELKLFLSGSGDKDSTDYVSAMVGDYESTRMSYRRKGVFGGKSDGNYSPERRPIIEARDMMGLRERGEAIAFVYGHYIRCKKLRYFEDPYIAPILKRRQEQMKLQTQAQVEPTTKDIDHERKEDKERTG